MMSENEPDASAVRGAADWVLYWYGDRSHQGEDDQTSAARWALGDDLADQLISVATKVDERNAQLAEAIALLNRFGPGCWASVPQGELRAILTRHLGD